MRSEIKKRKKWPRIVGLTLLFTMLAGGAYAYYIYNSVTNTVANMYKPIVHEEPEKRVNEVLPAANKQPTTKPITPRAPATTKKPFSVLMLGVDQRPGDKGRSDTIIVLTVNPNKKSVKMLSIPRDTRTEIIGKGKEDKINHAYAFGGVQMSVNTVEHFLGIPIDYYMKVNMEGLRDVVDAIGGVKVHNDLDFTSDGVHFPIGEVSLNGKTALSYSRMRYEDPHGDFGRQSRQRKIIQEVINKGASFSTLSNYKGVLGAMEKNIQTNMTLNEMIDIQKNYIQAREHIEQEALEGNGTKMNKIYYFIVSPEEKQRVHNELMNHLEI
ncbi:LCP family protein [Neobacillus sp. PS3-34]|uniref:LCP family glycopolymer transferase n=1 Tax=Neobacillus sp. PS3-34 TaxID=3070678 RepID=UPI0027E08D76|nr:LCP family protein [Neobacillus sp. PS3-34]WML46807.1 LCP family protein [Neobacillus sp. PS3-34]